MPSNEKLQEKTSPFAYIANDFITEGGEEAYLEQVRYQIQQINTQQEESRDALEPLYLHIVPAIIKDERFNPNSVIGIIECFSPGLIFNYFIDNIVSNPRFETELIAPILKSCIQDGWGGRIAQIHLPQLIDRAGHNRQTILGIIGSYFPPAQQEGEGQNDARAEIYGVKNVFSYVIPKLVDKLYGQNQEGYKEEEVIHFLALGNQLDGFILPTTTEYTLLFLRAQGLIDKSSQTFDKSFDNFFSNLGITDATDRLLSLQNFFPDFWSLYKNKHYILTPEKSLKLILPMLIQIVLHMTPQDLGNHIETTHGNTAKLNLSKTGWLIFQTLLFSGLDFYSSEYGFKGGSDIIRILQRQVDIRNADNDVFETTTSPSVFKIPKVKTTYFLPESKVGKLEVLNSQIKAEIAKINTGETVLTEFEPNGFYSYFKYLHDVINEGALRTKPELSEQFENLVSILQRAAKLHSTKQEVLDKQVEVIIERNNSPVSQALTGPIADACYTGKIIPPNIHVYNLISSGNVKGNFLAIETTYANKKIIVLRAINPTQTFVTNVDPEELLSAIINKIAIDFPGVSVALINDAAGRASTNRPVIAEAISRLRKSYRPDLVEELEHPLPDDATFNGYTLGGRYGSIVFILPRS